VKIERIRALGGRAGVRSEILLVVYKAYIRSVVEFGCAAFVTAAGTQLAKVQVVQNEALRIALRCPRWTPIEQLHLMAEMPMLREHLEQRAIEFVTRALSLNPLVGELVGLNRGLQAWYPSSPLAVIEERLPLGPWNRPDIVRKRVFETVNPCETAVIATNALAMMKSPSSSSLCLQG